MKQIQASELVINSRGAIYHLNLTPSELADTVLLVGDQGRVELISKYFDHVEVTSQHREFVTHTGTYQRKRISVISTGIGTDNIDIVLNELDALANIDFETRTVNKKLKSLTIVRLGTSGAIQPDIPVGSIVKTEIAIGFDGLLNFYANRNRISMVDYEEAFAQHTNWSSDLPRLYFVEAGSSLIEKFKNSFLAGMTISAPGFYGPQGRVLRIPLADPNINSKIESFEHKGQKVTNFEMEGSAIFGLSKHLGHQALTVCAIIANRITKDFDSNYQDTIDRMIRESLDVLSK